MKNYRITVNCQMKNTKERQEKIDNGNKYVSDNTRNYTEYIYTEAESALKAYRFAQNETRQKTNRSYEKDKIFGFTVDYSLTDEKSSVKSIGATIINDDDLGFSLSFAISRMIIFEARYDRTGNNKYMDFATSAFRFNRPKTDCIEGGQVQKQLLPKGSKARQFFDKWDNLHLNRLGDLEYSELLKDIETLKDNYYFITDTNFNKQRSLSMTIPKKYSIFGGNNIERA